ncbi:aldehyde dehydrogenase family protein [Bacillus rhizoplanae]|uniref:aldehyde dehydrogenase family protein n=1 Tax=Bacillus TaxID=1386 RepID=UPI003F5D4205
MLYRKQRCFTINNKKFQNLSFQKIEAGIVWINTWFLRNLRTSFSGMKQSSIECEGGMHSFEFYSELSNIYIKL